jgi:hypothetical protein
MPENLGHLWLAFSKFALAFLEKPVGGQRSQVIGSYSCSLRYSWLKSQNGNNGNRMSPLLGLDPWSNTLLVRSFVG